MNMPEDAYFDHKADIGIIGRGQTVEAAFEDAARATFAIMVDPADISDKEQIAVDFTESDLEFALVTWLNHLLTESHQHGLALNRFQLTRNDDHWSGQAWGSPWQEETVRGTEVKGATLTQLSVKQDDDGQWEARCVVDV